MRATTDSTIAAAAALLLVACGGPSEPDTPPDVRGTYSGEWALDLQSSSSSSFTRCSGTVTLSSQDGNSFSGSYEVAASGDGDCTELAGGVSEGTVGSQGILAFVLRASAGNPLEILTGCSLTLGNARMQGQLSNQGTQDPLQLEAGTQFELTCDQGDGPTNFSGSLAFRGTRQSS